MLAMVGAGNAGLASHFIDLAHAKIKASGGVLALVLPASFLQGRSWTAARRLLDDHYDDVVVISIAAAGTTARAFSADTGMAEVLIIATRRPDAEQTSKSVTFVNLKGRPQTILEAVSMARAIQEIPDNRPVSQISFGSHERAGCSIRSALSDTGCAGVRDADLAHTASELEGGELHLPRFPGSITLWTCPVFTDG